MGRSPKRIMAKNIMTLIKFSQDMMQGGQINKDPMSQINHFGEEQCKKLKQLMPNGCNIFKYCKMEPSERKELSTKLWAENALANF